MKNINWWKVGAVVWAAYLFVAGYQSGIWNAINLAALVLSVFMFGYYAKEHDDNIAAEKRRNQQKAKSPYAMYWTSEKDSEKGQV